MRTTETMRETQIESRDRAVRLFDKAEREGRELTKEEQSAFDEHYANVKSLGGRIETQKRCEELTRAESRQVIPALGPIDNPNAPHMPYGTRTAQPGPQYRDSMGREVRVFEKNDSMRERFIHSAEQRGEDVNPLRGLRFGNAMTGLLRGSWIGFEGEQRVMSTATNTLGGYMVPELLSNEVIDLARSQSAVFQAGARTVAMDGSAVVFARVTADPTLEFKTEGANWTGTNMTLDSIRLQALTLGCKVIVTEEMLQDAPNFGETLTMSLAAAIAAEVDRVCLIGNGGSEPTGLKTNASVNQVPAVGTPTDYAELLAAWALILADNGQPNAYMMAPRDAVTYEGLTEATTNGYLQPPAAIKAMTRYIVSKLPITEVGGAESSMYLGDFSQLWIGVRQGLKIDFVTNPDNYTQTVQCTWRGNMNFAHANHFARLYGVTA